MSRRPAARGTSQVTLGSAPRPRSGRLSWWWKAPLGVLVALILVVMVGTIAFGATRPDTGNPPAPEPSGSSPTPTDLFSPLVTQPELDSPPDLPELDAEILAIQEKYHVAIGITMTAVSGVYQRQQATWYGGTLRSGDALATIDVPMALAILDQERQPQQRDYMFNKALADNSAAGDEALWAFLGTPEQAAAQTTQLLRDYADHHTVVPWQVDGDESGAPYLATQWALDGQSQLMAAMRCDFTEVNPVLNKLNDPATDPWGLQTLPMTYSKGAWGSVSSGGTLVRQFGLIRLSDGNTVGIAMAVSQASDDPAIGQGAITELSTKVRAMATGFDAMNCG
ncbi:hypothetical protein [Brooklawnia sp.]|uniref:hypothetical protein n=1 Tax=Brooklawnia sp. TaxID=2699740 RepID=UPI00311D49A6